MSCVDKTKLTLFNYVKFTNLFTVLYYYDESFTNENN